MDITVHMMIHHPQWMSDTVLHTMNMSMNDGYLNHSFHG